MPRPGLPSSSEIVPVPHESGSNYPDSAVVSETQPQSYPSSRSGWPCAGRSGETSHFTPDGQMRGLWPRFAATQPGQKQEAHPKPTCGPGSKGQLGVLFEQLLGQ